MDKNNKIIIGNNNTIKNSTVTNNMNFEKAQEKWYSKLFWKFFIPIAIAVISAAICMYLKIA